MSLLDKFNDSISESNDNNDLYKSQCEELESQLSKANEINNQNIKELNELKTLISEYTTYMDNLKLSYINTINDLKHQLNFEKEINEKYLQKIIESNKDLDADIKNLNSKSDDNIKELSVLFDNNKNDLSDSANKIINELSTNDSKKESAGSQKELDDLKNIINSNNQELINLFNEFKEEMNNSNKEIVEELNTPDEKLGNIEKLLKTNREEFSILINKNKENQDNNISKIIEEINNQNKSHPITDKTINEVKELLHHNKEQINNLTTQSIEAHDQTTNKIIEELSNTNQENISDNLLTKVEESIQKKHNQLIESLDTTTDITKIEILNKISNDLKNGDYVNLLAYKKIKDMKLFDEVFYKKTYDYDLDIDPLLHFIYKGYEENKQPNKKFNPLQYKHSNKKIEESTLNPLVYFVTEGIHEGNIKINKDFDEIEHINKFEIDEKLKSFTDRGVKKSKRKPRIIVSLTSIPERMYDVHYTLYSLLNQQVKPDKVILWLSNEDFPNGELDLPKEVLALQRNGLSIRFCDELKSYKKIIPALETYPNDIIVTADDDIFYPPNWLKILYEDYRRNENDIIAHRVRRINMNNGKIDDYCTWKLNDKTDDYSFLNFAT
ncbi:MAG TPA: hypothetical protein HA255_00480, partial [Methanosphaera sp.]|nr:hypothetical protein [Methanosphaera sp.]